MDHHLTPPPIAALQNLTITDDSLTPPTTALQNLTITTNTNTPLKPNSNPNPNPNPSRQEQYKRAYLNALLRQWYKPSSPDPDPSYILSKERIRTTQLRFRTFERPSKRATLRITRNTGNVVEYGVIGERISRLLCSMAEDKPEFRHRLRLANRYVQLRENQEEVFSIVKSLY